MALIRSTLCAVLLLAGCASTEVVQQKSTAAPPTELVTEDVRAGLIGTGHSQQLFRLTIDGAEGRVTLRAVLRESPAAGRFQLAISDLAGRRVLGLDVQGDDALLIDHREKTFCRSPLSELLVSIHPSELDFAMLPRILRAEFPVAEASVSPASPQVESADGVWKTSWANDELESWMLHRDGSPSVWWTRQPDGGILSRRTGEQYRWTLGVSEDSQEALPDLLPSKYREGLCESANAP